MKEAPGFTLLEHGADLRVRATGSSFRETLSHLLWGLFHLMAEGSVSPEGTWVVQVPGPMATAVVDIVNEILLLHDAEGLVFSGVTVYVPSAGKSNLRIILEGERFDSNRHTMLRQIKAATYHGLVVTDTLVEMTLDV